MPKNQVLARNKQYVQFRNLSDFYQNQFTFLLQDAANDKLEAALTNAVNEVVQLTQWVLGSPVKSQFNQHSAQHWNVKLDSKIDGEPLTHQICIEFVQKSATVIDAQLQSLIKLTDYNNELLQALIQSSEGRTIELPEKTELPKVKNVTNIIHLPIIFFSESVFYIIFVNCIQ